jgi:hypothetical protein
VAHPGGRNRSGRKDRERRRLHRLIGPRATGESGRRAMLEADTVFASGGVSRRLPA